MRKFISFSLAVGIIAAGVGIQPALAKTPNDTLVMAWSLSIYRTLDPADVGEAFVDEVMNNVCDAAIFLDYDDPSKLVPGIVESWSVSDDAQTYTFKIRQGLKFPGTGNPVRAEDLAWSMQRVVRGRTAERQNLHRQRPSTPPRYRRTREPASIPTWHRARNPRAPQSHNLR